MWEILIITTIIAIGNAVAAYLTAPKPVKPRSPTLEDIKAPTAEQGRPIPIPFGTVWVEGPNVVWYGDLHYEPIKK